MSALQRMMTKRKATAIKLSYGRRGRDFKAFAIPKAALRAFFARERRDYRKWKDYDEAKLDEMMLRLPVRPPIWTRLRKLQKVCFLIGARTGRFFFMNDMGTGKTLLIIALARYFRKLGTRRALILVPNRINKEEWQAELEKHAPRSTSLLLPSSIQGKWDALLSTDTLFVFETYAGLMRMVTKPLAKAKGKKKAGSLIPNPTLLKRLAEQFDFIAGDESAYAKGAKKLPFRILRALSKRMDQVFMMTGTPFNRDPLDIWSQMFLCDQGKTLGENIGLFRAAFYTAKKGHWTSWDYTFDKTKDELFHDMLAGGSISYPADDDSLPKVLRVPKVIRLREDAGAYYERAKQELRRAHGNATEVQNIFLRMRQISSGFIGYKNDETGTRAEFEFPENPKLEMLLSIIQEIRPDHQYIIFYDFTWSAFKIKRELAALDIPILHLYGGTKNVKQVRDQFKSGETQGLLLQNQFGIGLNIQVAKYGLFYESPVSAIVRKQCERRVERQHSTHARVQLWDLICKDTMDERILAAHKAGGDLFKALVRGEF